MAGFAMFQTRDPAGVKSRLVEGASRSSTFTRMARSGHHGNDGPTTTTNIPLLVGTDRLRQMDEQGIDIEVLSINPFWYGADRDLATRLIKTQNEKLAEFCNAHSDRFVGLATVALQHPDLAAQATGRRYAEARTSRRFGWRHREQRGVWPHQGSIRSGQRPKNWARRYSFTHKAFPNFDLASKVTAY